MARTRARKGTTKRSTRPKKASADPLEAEPPKAGAEAELGEPVLLWCGRCKHLEASFFGDHQCRRGHDLGDLAFIPTCPDRDNFPATDQPSYDLSE